MKLRDTINPEKRVKAYLHSYLKWLHYQNNQFSETLTDLEIYNYFIKELNHPEWFRKYLENNSIQRVADVYEFLSDFKRDSIMFSYTEEINPKKIGAYKDIKKEEEELICF